MYGDDFVTHPRTVTSPILLNSIIAAVENAFVNFENCPFPPMVPNKVTVISGAGLETNKDIVVVVSVSDVRVNVVTDDSNA
jgi:hypothetical protein